MAYSRCNETKDRTGRPVVDRACGCATPAPVLTDFSEIKAEVRVRYDTLVGPSIEDARKAADPIADEHCQSLSKNAVYVSGREEAEYAGTIVSDTSNSYPEGWGGGVSSTNIYMTEYVFLYRCEDEAPPGP